MKDNGSFLVYDLGYYTHIAELLSRYSKTPVGYYSPWQSTFPISDDLMVGDGFKNVERIKYLWNEIYKYDTVVFPYCFNPDLQIFLTEQGVNVWGGKNAEKLETDRIFCHEYLKELGLPVQKWWVCEGIDDLRKFLKSNKDVYVKPSLRGDFETIHCESYELVERWIDDLAHGLGDKKDYEVFFIEKGIDAEVEVGIDTYFVGGFPNKAIVGYEIKDCGFIGAIMPYADVSKHIRYVNKVIEPFLVENDMRGFMSTEIRITKDGEPYLIDPCMRAGSPCSEGYGELITNWGDIISSGAKGILVNPTHDFKYVCEIVIYSGWGTKNWLDIKVPPEYRKYVKLNFACEIDNKYIRIPVPDGVSQVGCVVGLGDTVEEAVTVANDIRKEVKGLEVKFDLGSMDLALEQIKAGQKLGISFGDSDIPDHIDL